LAGRISAPTRLTHQWPTALLDLPWKCGDQRRRGAGGGSTSASQAVATRMARVSTVPRPHFARAQCSLESETTLPRETLSEASQAPRLSPQGAPWRWRADRCATHAARRTPSPSLIAHPAVLTTP